MRRGTFVVAASVMVAAAVAVRIHNALAFPSLHGYDGFGHFTYIWYMSKTWRVPLSTAGWSFFHPPLYYALMALLWDSLRGIDPLLRLSIGSLVMSLLSITHALVSYIIVKRYFPKQRLIHLLAPGMMLFLPVHIYSAPFIGNEGLAAVLCSVAILALLSALRRPSLARSAMLGLWLGLAMLTKFTALAVVAGSFVTLALKGLRYWRTGTAMRHLAVVAGVMLTICGWYYARNIHLYGTPFKLSRSEFMVRHVENIQTKGRRGVMEYLLFDPVILRRPQWPRGLPLVGPLPKQIPRSALRESVWTGVYANTWFDAGSMQVLPPVTVSELSRRSGQVLLCLGVIPTLLVILGLYTAVKKLWSTGWDDTLLVMLLSFASMILIFAHGTRVVPMHVAVKATYLMPVTVAFSFWFALGLERLRASRPTWLKYIALECSILALASLVVFSHGLMFKRWNPEGDHPFVWGNIYGVVYYASGDREKAKELFSAAAASNSYLGYENLASMALEEEKPLKALYFLKNAARLEPRQSFGIKTDRRYFNMITQAEYLNSMAVIYHELGWEDQALAAAREAIRRDKTITEALYNLGVLELSEAGQETKNPGTDRRAVAIEQARRHLTRAVLLDPGFAPAAMTLAVTQALEGDCTGAQETIKQARRNATVQRKFPVETGRGIPHAPSIGRRKYIHPLPPALQPENQLAACGGRLVRL